MKVAAAPTWLAHRPAWLTALANGAALMGADMRRHWVPFTVLVAVWVLALVRLFVHHTPLVPLLFNWTPSLPYRVVYVVHIDPATTSLARGDLVVYAFEGQAAERDYPGLRHQAFFKRVVGTAGDVITVKDRQVSVNGVAVGVAKTHTFDRRRLDPIDATVIPPGFLYVQGSSPDSFDSRYRSSGLVRLSDVKAKVRPLF
jgi:conjugal transfer pilin signal peptidase TrbI